MTRLRPVGAPGATPEMHAWAGTVLSGPLSAGIAGGACCPDAAAAKPARPIRRPSFVQISEHHPVGFLTLVRQSRSGRLPFAPRFSRPPWRFLSSCRPSRSVHTGESPICRLTGFRRSRQILGALACGPLHHPASSDDFRATAAGVRHLPPFGPAPGALLVQLRRQRQPIIVAWSTSSAHRSRRPFGHLGARQLAWLRRPCRP